MRVRHQVQLKKHGLDPSPRAAQASGELYYKSNPLWGTWNIKILIISTFLPLTCIQMKNHQVRNSLVFETIWWKVLTLLLFQKNSSDWKEKKEEKKEKKKKACSCCYSLGTAGIPVSERKGSRELTAQQLRTCVLEAARQSRWWNDFCQ